MVNLLKGQPQSGKAFCRYLVSAFTAAAAKLPSSARHGAAADEEEDADPHLPRCGARHRKQRQCRVKRCSALDTSACSACAGKQVRLGRSPFSTLCRFWSSSAPPCVRQTTAMVCPGVLRVCCACCGRSGTSAGGAVPAEHVLGLASSLMGHMLATCTHLQGGEGASRDGGIAKKAKGARGGAAGRKGSDKPGAGARLRPSLLLACARACAAAKRVGSGSAVLCVGVRLCAGTKRRKQPSSNGRRSNGAAGAGAWEPAEQGEARATERSSRGQR